MPFRLIASLSSDLKENEVLPEPHNLIHRPPNRLPAGLAFAAENLRQSIAPADAAQETEGVADVALAAGVCADEDGEGAEAQGFVGKVFEIDQTYGGNHDRASLAGFVHATALSAPLTGANLYTQNTGMTFSQAVKVLEEAGFNQEQARAVAEAVGESVATKADLLELELHLSEKFDTKLDALDKN